MQELAFVDDVDSTTFAPFSLIDCRQSEWPGVRLSFGDWDWLLEKLGTDTVDGYYMNGHSLQGLVLAARVHAGLEAYPAGVEPASEGDTCFIIFDDLATAVETARLASAMINDRSRIEQMIQVGIRRRVMRQVQRLRVALVHSLGATCDFPADGRM